MEEPERNETYSSDETGGAPADDEPRPVDHDPPREGDEPRFDEAQRTEPSERAAESTDSPAEQSPKP